MLEAVIGIARDAGGVVLGHYARAAGDLEVMHKADQSPLTRADRESNALIVDRLRALAPAIPILAEESPIPPFEERRDWRRFWLVDPLDGTKEFLARNGEFSVNIALVEGGEPVLGVLLVPAHGVLYYAEAGGGAWRAEAEEAPRRIFSAPPPPDRPLRVITSRSHRGGDVRDYLAGRVVAEEIHAGSALKFGLLAEGKADVYVRTTPTSEWDVAAGDCIFRNSAREGRRTSPLRYNKPTLRNPGFAIGLEP